MEATINLDLKVEDISTYELERPGEPNMGKMPPQALTINTQNQTNKQLVGSIKPKLVPPAFTQEASAG